MLRGYVLEGAAIGVHEVLVVLAADIALDPTEALVVLESGGYSDEVRADEQRARELDISGVPFFVMAGRYGVSGA